MMNSNGANFEDSAALLQQLLSNGFLGQGSGGNGNIANGGGPFQDPQQQHQSMSFANSSLYSMSGSQQQQQMNNMMLQAAGQGSSNLATSCSLSRWIATQQESTNNQLAVAAAMSMPSTATAMSLQGQRQQHQPFQQNQQQQTTDNEPFPLTSISFPDGSNNNNGNTVMNMQDLLLGGGEQVSSASNVELPHRVSAVAATSSLVSDNDLDSSASGASVAAAKAARFRRDQAEQWSERYDELILFLKEQGHCRVPRNHKKFGALSSWVKRQRYQYKLRQEGKPSFLTDERVAVLDRLGFVWDSHSSVWEQRFQELQAFQRQFGHSNVPYNYKNAKLASWIKAQRREMRAFKEGKTISPDMFQRFLKLEKLNFCWQLRTSGRKNQSDEAKIEQLSAY